MDGPDLPISQSVRCGRPAADAAPVDSAREGTSIVYFANAEDVSEGFAIALRAMGFEEVLLPDIMPSDLTSKPGDG
jgi:hypothetical protein